MRSHWAGLIFLLIAPAWALAQVSGSVESIGFQSYIRPDCWNPMVITVMPETGKTDFYQIHVKLQDLDRDLPIYERTISVTGAAEGQNRMQRFRMYFIPPPTDQGLPDATDPGAARELQDRLKVSLHNSSGKWICDLPLTGTLRNVDPKPNYGVARRGVKLVLAVNDGQSRPIYQDMTASDVLGVTEDVWMVPIRTEDLPENVLGYEAVDAIVWLDADPAQIRSGGADDRYRALETYVRRGGKLVVCQPAEWQKMLVMQDLLPVTIEGIEEKDNLLPLRAMAIPPTSAFPIGEAPSQLIDPFGSLMPPFRFARAVAKPNSVVNEWITWKTEKDVSPYLVRAPLGLGSVTWVAQDLGDPTLTRNRFGWPYVWDRVFDWKNSPLLVTNQTPSNIRRPYENGNPLDLGASLIGTRMDLQSKSAWLISLAVVFFIGYWAIAGPGAYTLLATRRKTHLSWFIFGACAVVATALTVLIVRLVLRGPPELKHFTIVRVAPDQPALVISRFGLYIPRDGYQSIELKDAAPDAITSISAFPIHPALLGDDVPSETGPEYTVPVIDPSSGKAAGLSFKYRSTLKKFQAVWAGQIDGAVTGSGKLTQQNWIAGSLTNGTGRPLRNVYIAFHHPGGFAGLAADWVLYLPSWESAVTLDLEREFNRDAEGKTMPIGFVDRTFWPNGISKVRGKLDLDWWNYWIRNLPAGVMNTTLNDSSESMPRSLPMLSFFDRLPPMRNMPGQGERIDFMRRGGRMLDVSCSISAGALVILAEADGPLPFPLEVEGNRIGGEGKIFYQFILPLDHSAVASTTQPTAE